MGAVRLYLPDASVKPDINEAIRYMGYGKNIPDEATAAAVRECANELSGKLCGKCCYAETEAEFFPGGVRLDGIEMKSAALAKNLAGCQRAYIFAATVGIEADRLIRKYAAVSPAREVITDALASSAVEVLCDMLCEFLEKEAGEPLRPRFSPGYGDLDLSLQRDLCMRLDTVRKIGLTLTDSLLMMPSKSVTAIAGITDGGVKISC